MIAILGYTVVRPSGGFPGSPVWDIIQTGESGRRRVRGQDCVHLNDEH